MQSNLSPVGFQGPYHHKKQNKLIKNNCQILTNGQLYTEKRTVVHALRYDLFSQNNIIYEFIML